MENAVLGCVEWCIAKGGVVQRRCTKTWWELIWNMYSLNHWIWAGTGETGHEDDHKNGKPVVW